MFLTQGLTNVGNKADHSSEYFVFYTMVKANTSDWIADIYLNVRVVK